MNITQDIFHIDHYGWITQDTYLEWFKFFIPPARPVGEDGSSDMHLLLFTILIHPIYCSHWTVVFIKSTISKHVDTLGNKPVTLASLVGDIPVNILSGFKSRFSPLNPSEVNARMLAPAKVFKPFTDDKSSHTSPTLSPEQITLYEMMYVTLNTLSHRMQIP